MLTTIRNFFHHAWEDFKAFRRGERRVAPYGTTGRIFQRKSAGGAGTVVRLAAPEPTATLTMKITRANGTVETIVVPAKVLKAPSNG